MVEEARRNLALKAPERMSALAQLLSGMAMAAATPGRGDRTLETSLRLPAKDRPVLVAALALGCDALVTGDGTHFGALYGRTIQGVTIHSPRSLAEALLS